jgi:RNA:NAD 2'-phosphotransferase (TPT1/KptA family)
MAINPKEGKLLYHLTSIDNLPNIIQEGLKPRSNLSKFVDIADMEIIGHRKEYELDKYIIVLPICRTTG